MSSARSPDGNFGLRQVSQDLDFSLVFATLLLRVVAFDFVQGLPGFMIGAESLKLLVVWVTPRPVDLELHNELTFSLACGHAVLSFLNRRFISKSGDFHFRCHQEIHLGGLVSRLSSCVAERGEKSLNSCRQFCSVAVMTIVEVFGVHEVYSGL